ncbi:MAG: class I SAM-dependent methyltransferase [Acidobacteria bacterium]|nr:class I SAM-dependent methyltransferase [Acidobacteriota bacterium]
MIKPFSKEQLLTIKASLSEEDCDEMAIPSYLHRNPVLRWMAWRRVKKVAETADQIRQTLNRPLNVVDYGCGIGVLFSVLTKLAHRTTAIDIVPGPARMTVATHHYSGIEVITPDVWAPQKESLDLIIAAEVLEHIDPVETVLKRFKDALKPSGYLLVSLPTENRFYRFGRWLAGFSGHYHHQNAASLHRSIQQAGFTMKHREMIPLPGPLAVYWIVSYTHS